MRTLAGVVFTLWLLACPAMSQLLEENGSLRDFLAGDNVNSAYDNWVNHITEGIADPGYNEYAPDYIDPQTNGFGAFRFIPDTPDGDQTIEHWDNIFIAMLSGDIQIAAAMLADSAETFRYDAVRFTDTSLGRVYYMFREQLDMSYYDNSGTPYPEDDIHGSFRNGWGVFIYNPNATRPHVMVQVVHPCDDFFTPYAAIDLFLEIDAGTFCMNGAGREVLWTGEGSYSNSKSLSDPSRNENTPFQRFVERFVDSCGDQYPNSAFAVQLHTFDPSHNLITPIILSAGFYQTNPSMPLRDLRREGNDLCHLTPHPVFEWGDWIGNNGPLPELPVDDYFAINCDDDYYVHIGQNDSLRVPRATTLRGDPNNEQGRYLYDEDHNYYPNQVLDPFLHFEMDEYPAYLEDNDFPREDLFIVTQLQPPTIDTFAPMQQFYEPFLNSIVLWLDWMDEPVSIAIPPRIESVEAFGDGTGSFQIRWDPVWDGHHLTYEILADSIPVTEQSPVIWRVEDDPWLRVMGLDEWTVVESVPTDLAVHWVAMRIRDLGGNLSQISLPLSIVVEDINGVGLTVDAVPEYPAEAWPLWVYAYPDCDDIADIYAIWRINGELQPLPIYLEPVGELGAWAAALPENTNVQAGDLIEYLFITHDTSLDGNELIFPETGWYETTLSEMTSMFEVADFESTHSFITIHGEWQIGPPTFGPASAYSGENVVATILDGPYSADLSSFLAFNDRVRPEYGPLVLVYEQWHEYLLDTQIPGAAIDGGRIGSDFPGFGELAPVGEYPYRIPGSNFDGDDVFSGSNGEWETVAVDLTPMYGGHASLYFESITHGNVGLAGWYLDDIRIVRETNLQLPQPFSLLTPEDGASAEDETVNFTWEECVDFDPVAIADYTFYLYAHLETIEIPVGTATTHYVSLEELDLTINGPPQLTWNLRAISQGDTVWSNETFTLLNPFSDVSDSEDGLPKEFALREVWPNPFNSAISLRYQLPRDSHVKAMLYNVLGQRVATIENERRIAGTHRLSWQADGLASGVYFLRLELDDKTFTRKLVLMK